MAIDVVKASGRAKCRKCFEKIHEGELCLRYVHRFQNWWVHQYVHMDCVLDKKIIRKFHFQTRVKEASKNGRETNTH